MYIAELKTSHFAFLATGETEDKALAALEKGWHEHRKSINDHEWSWVVDRCSINVRRVPLGGCERSTIGVPASLVQGLLISEGS